MLVRGWGGAGYEVRVCEVGCRADCKSVYFVRVTQNHQKPTAGLPSVRLRILEVFGKWFWGVLKLAEERVVRKRRENRAAGSVFELRFW